MVNIGLHDMSDHTCDVHSIERDLGLCLTMINQSGINPKSLHVCKFYKICCTETLLSYPAKGLRLTAGGIRDIARNKDLDHQV